MKKLASAHHAIHPLLGHRWSPRSFADRDVAPEAVRSLLEAARWAPSCLNEQPWRFIVATRGETETYSKLESCLTPANQAWASKAAVLFFAVAKVNFDKTGEPNRHAWHDVGLSVAQLTVQATSLGLAVHQMAGIDVQRARDVLRIPEGFEPVTAIAVGHPGEPDALPHPLRQREVAPRARLHQRDIAFGGSFGEPLSFEAEVDQEQVLSFWFGQPSEAGLASDGHLARWWKKDPAFDDEIRQSFGELHQAIVDGKHESWRNSARGRLAYVIVLDQFSRNMYRDEPGMFAHDEQARNAAKAGIELGMDRAVPGDLRAFYYLPLMHSEDLADQEQCVALFQSLVDELDGKARERFANNLKFAIAHRDIVAKWGRFPHRNAVLGRESTQEELAFLEQPGSSF